MLIWPDSVCQLFFGATRITCARLIYLNIMARLAWSERCADGQIITDIFIYIPNIPDCTRNYQIWCLADPTWRLLANGLTFEESDISSVERSPRDLQWQMCSRCMLCHHNNKSKMGNITDILVCHYNFWLVLQTCQDKVGVYYGFL